MHSGSAENICESRKLLVDACEARRPVAAVSSPHEGSSPTGVSADGGWIVEDAEDGRMLGGGARVEAGGCPRSAPVCSPLAIL